MVSLKSILRCSPVCHSRSAQNTCPIDTIRPDSKQEKQFRHATAVDASASVASVIGLKDSLSSNRYEHAVAKLDDPLPPLPRKTALMMTSRRTG